MNQPLGSPSAEVHRDTNLLLEGVLPHQPALALARRVLMLRPRIEVQTRWLGRRTTLASAPGGAAKPGAGFADSSVVLVSSRLTTPWEVTEEFFADNPDLTEERMETAMNVAVGNDLSDLAFNGDEESNDQLLRATDGWIKRMTTWRKWTLRRRQVRRAELTRALWSLAPHFRTKPEELRFFVSPQTYMDVLEEQTENLADDYLSGKVPEHLAVSGVPLQMVAMIPEGHALLSHPDNLIVGFEKDYKVRRTTEGKEAIERDSRLYAAHIRMALAVQDPEAGFHIEARPWHMLLGRFGAFVSRRYTRAKWATKRAIQRAKNRHQGRKQARALKKELAKLEVATTPEDQQA